MPRKREYESDAARAKAYRERREAETVRLDPQLLTDLGAAVEAAARAGDPVAKLVKTGTVESLLLNLCLYFQRAAAAAEGGRDRVPGPKAGHKASPREKGA
jgi:hypothetical protein